MANAYTGGLTRLVADAMENTTSLYQTDTFSEIPFLRAFARKITSPRDRAPSRTIELFYEEYQQLKSRKDTFKESIRNPKSGFMERSPKMRRLKKMEKIARDLSKSWVKIREAKTKEELYGYYEELDKKLDKYRKMK